MTPLGVNRARTILLAFHSNYIHMLHRFRDIARYWLKIAVLIYPISVCRHRWGQPLEPLEFRREFWHQKTEVPGYHMVLFCDSRFSHLSRTPTCDGWTDRRTHDDSIYRASITSRGKSLWGVLPFTLCDTKM